MIEPFRRLKAQVKEVTDIPVSGLSSEVSPVCDGHVYLVAAFSGALVITYLKLTTVHVSGVTKLLLFLFVMISRMKNLVSAVDLPASCQLLSIQQMLSFMLLLTLLMPCLLFKSLVA